MSRKDSSVWLWDEIQEIRGNGSCWYFKQNIHGTGIRKEENDRIKKNKSNKKEINMVK